LARSDGEKYVQMFICNIWPKQLAFSLRNPDRIIIVEGTVKVGMIGGLVEEGFEVGGCRKSGDGYFP